MPTQLTNDQAQQLVTHWPECKIVLDGNSLIAAITSICQVSGYGEGKLDPAIMKEAAMAMHEAEGKFVDIAFRLAMSYGG